MRLLMLAGLAAVLAAPAAFARAIPDPHQKHAPGNEMAQTPIAQAGYGTATNYQLQCAGCHLGSGEGSRHNDTPKMAGFVGNFLRVEGGREFLVRVPGVSQSALSDAQTAELLNWLLGPGGMAGASTPVDFQPYTGEEVSRVRHETILNLPGTRAGLIARMREQGIAIEDGMGTPESVPETLRQRSGRLMPAQSFQRCAAAAPSQTKTGGASLSRQFSLSAAAPTAHRISARCTPT